MRIDLPALRSFLNDRRGATAVWFGIAAMVLVVLVLGGIDVSRAMAEKSRLQNALDAATLFAARSGELNNKDLNAVGQLALKAQLAGAKGFADTVTATFKNGKDGEVVATASAKMDPIIMNLFVGDKLVVGADTTVKRGQDKAVEMVLVLDTTGSMAGAKLAGLKLAATALVDTITADPKAKVKLGLVPFGQYVNTGVSRRNQPWMNVPADWTETIGGKCTTVTSQTTCQSETYACTKYNDGTPYQTTCTRSFNCVTTAIAPKTVCSGGTTVQHRYNGCTGSPAYPRNVTDNDTTRRYPGFLDLTCGAEITPLTSSPGTIKNSIASLNATGLTYIPGGLAWGFNLISQPIPFTEAEAYDPSGGNAKPRKAIVLMTDGENTRLMNASTGRHDGAIAAGGVAVQANAYTAELCRNIKAANIEVFTVAFQVNDTTAKNMLRTCASSPQHYFDARDTPALIKAFEQIAMSMRSLFIAN